MKPFRFKLKKFSQKHLTLMDGLLRFLSAVGDPQHFHQVVRNSIRKYIPDFNYYLERIDPLSFKEFQNRLPPMTSVAVFRMEPFAQRGFLEMDLALHYCVVEKLLGGGESGNPELRPLTETEQGAMEFILLKMLTQIHQWGGEAAKLHFRMEQMVVEPAHLRDLEKEDSPYLCLTLHVSLLKRSGFIKVYLPHPWLLEGWLPMLHENVFEKKEMAKRLAQFEGIRTSVRGILGESQLNWGDVKNLEEGDVILFDESQLQHQDKKWTGDVRLKIGNGESEGFVAEWNGFNDRGRVAIKGGDRG